MSLRTAAQRISRELKAISWKEVSMTTLEAEEAEPPQNAVW